MIMRHLYLGTEGMPMTVTDYSAACYSGSGTHLFRVISASSVYRDLELSCLSPRLQRPSYVARKT